MTLDEAVAQGAEASRPQPDVDWLLQRFVSLANLVPSLEFGVTLQCGGRLVSGTLIGGQTYRTEVCTELRSFNADFWAEVVESALEDLYLPKAPGEELTSADLAPSYVHLRAAKIFEPSQQPIPGNRGVLWRGRLSEVSGWWFGALSAGEQDDASDE